MAQKVETRITLVDDIDGTKAAETVTFAFDGRQYEIDLNRRNAQSFRADLERYATVARRVGSTKLKGRRRKVTNGKKRTSGPSPREVRQWAQANGVEVSSTGRVAQSVVEQYQAAHSQ